MRIAVISDTHDRLPPHVAEAIAAADEIWHLGDVTTKALLASVREIGPPVRNVREIATSAPSGRRPDDLELQGVKIRLIHIPPKRPPAGFDLLLHGHTHVPRDEMIGAVRYLNPGASAKPTKAHRRATRG
jgi:predicted phosphodiesterase